MRYQRLLSVVTIVIGCGLLGLHTGNDPLIQTDVDTKTIEVKGAVNQPGIYELPWNATVDDALAIAQGVADDGDLSDVNRTRNLTANEVLVIRKKAEEPCISINTASAEELDTLPGIGMKMAERIIAERKKEPFRQTEDIKRVKGIGDKLYAKMADRLCL